MTTELDAPRTRNVLRAALDRDTLDPTSRAMTFTASTAGVKRDGLIVELDGLSTTNFESNPVFLWAHDYSGRTLPIGKVTKLRKLKNRLDAVVEFDAADPFAVEVERKYRDGFLNAVSIGWSIETYERGIDGDDFDYRVMTSDLLDISAVPVPGDPQALLKTGRDLLSADGFLAALNDLDEDLDGDSTAARTEPVEGGVDVSDLVEQVSSLTARLDAIEASEPPLAEEPDSGVLDQLASILGALPEATKE